MLYHRKSLFVNRKCPSFTGLLLHTAVIVFLFSSCDILHAQSRKVDSLKAVFAMHSGDSTGLMALLKIANFYMESNDPANTTSIINNGIRIATMQGNNYVIGEMYRIQSEVYRKQENFGGQIKYSYKALKYFELAGNIQRQAIMLQGIGVANKYMGNAKEANDAFQKAFALRMSINDRVGIAQSKNTVAQMLLTENRVDSARALFFQALEIFLVIGDSVPWGLPLTYNGIGISYDVVGDSLWADNKKHLADPQFREAYKYYDLALKGWIRMGNIKAQEEARMNLGNIKMKLGEYSEARKLLDKAINSALQTKSTEHLRFGYMVYAELEEQCGNYKAALQYYRQYITYRDKIQNDENNQNDLQARMQYVFDKKEALAKAEQNKKDALTNAEIIRQKTTRNFTVASALLLFVFGGYVFYNFQRKKKAEKTEALAHERLRISRELHDDIGSTLGSLAVYSDVAKNRSLKNEKSMEVISKIGSASRELIDKMSDIIWSLNPANENFEQLKNRMEAFGSMILTPRNISVTYKFDNELLNIQMTGEQLKNIFLIYKEAIYNIVKYAESQNVFISVLKSGTGLILIIKDNGKGFIQNNSNGINHGQNGLGGNGIKNMMARAHEIHADLKITSNINEGTSVELNLTV